MSDEKKIDDGGPVRCPDCKHEYTGHPSLHCATACIRNLRADLAAERAASNRERFERIKELATERTQREQAEAQLAELKSVNRYQRGYGDGEKAARAQVERLTAENNALASDESGLAEQVERLRAIVAAIDYSEFCGVECNDVNGVNWFDAQKQALADTAPAPDGDKVQEPPA